MHERVTKKPMKTNRGSSQGRRSRSTVTTKSGNTLKINHSISDRLKSSKLARQTEKAAYLSTLPKNRFKRILYRLHPKRVAQYWFSREGGIMALKIVGISIVVCFFLTIGLFAYFRKDLPKIKDLSGNIGGSITYYDRTGKVILWQDYNDLKRTPVATGEMSPYIKQATVAIEDKGFYHEGAFDVRGIMRAAVHDAVGGGGGVQGGSTITQQLVKLNQNWTGNRTVTRKVKELILSVELERQYSKDDILTGYLNIAPYGGLDYGVETAAQDYFHTSAKDLTLPEAAMLAAIPQSPSYYSPFGSTRFNSAAGNTFNQGALIGRQQYILDQMAKQHYITPAQAMAAKKVDVLALVHPLENKYNNIKAPYFALAAKNELKQKFSETLVARGGWKVITTLNVDLQTKAEAIVAKNLPNVKRYGGDEEATVAENVPTGQIEALVGGVDFTQPDYGQINYADSVLIPPGSSFKPYDYTTLINNKGMNAGAGSVLYDTQGPIIDPTTGAGYSCTNKNSPKVDKKANCLWDYDFRYPGPVTLRYALAGSRNVPAVKAMIQAGVNKTISTASAMMDNTYLASKHQNTYNCYASGTDLTNATPQDQTQCYPSSAIGDGAFLHLDDHVNGLATLARLGTAIPRTFLLSVTDASGHSIYKWTQPKGNQVVDKDTAYIMNSMLSDPNATYLPSSYKFQHDNGWNFAVKTGTTNDNFDGLMTSWSTQYAVVSWVGYHTRNKAMAGGAMEIMTEPITRGLMEAAHASLKPINWVQPATVKVAAAYVIHSHVGIGSVEPSPSTDVYPNWYQAKTGNTSQVIDKVSGLTATSCTPDAAKSTEGNSNTNAFSVDQFINGTLNKNANASSTSAGATDNVHNCGDSPPTITLTVPDTCDATDNGGQGCAITATVTQGTHALTDPQYASYPGTVTFTLNGQVIKTSSVSDSPSTVSFFYAPTSNGTGNLSASVTDSVLYSGTDSANFTLAAAPASTPISSLDGKIAGINVNFTWSGGAASSGTFTVYRTDTNLTLCTAPAGTTNCQGLKSASPNGTAIGVKDTAGDAPALSAVHN